MAKRIYTKSGDKGTTSLYDRRWVSKDSSIIQFIGDLDELSAHIGLLCALLEDDREPHPFIVSDLRHIQLILLDIGSMACTVNHKKRLIEVKKEEIETIESWIDQLERINKPLKEFILVGVKPCDAQCHVCRAVCRRAERSLVSLLSSKLGKDYLPPIVLQYMNRLSDFFFVLARNLSRCREIRRSQG